MRFPIAQQRGDGSIPSRAQLRNKAAAREVPAKAGADGDSAFGERRGERPQPIAARAGISVGGDQNLRGGIYRL